jgi:hypothetical protein
MTKEEHTLGKALMGTIAITLVGLLIAFFMLGEKTIPINYMDDVVTKETKNIS